MADQILAPSEAAAAPRRARRISAVQQVYEGVRARIIDLSLVPGAAISKHELAAEFGVSQTPLREALLRLEEEGLVEIFPQSHTRVSLIDVQEAREAHFLRLSVEVEIARRVAAVIAAAEVRALRAIVERQVLEMKAGDLSAFATLDERFHQRIYELAGVGGLWELVRVKRAQFDRLRRLHLPTKGKVQAIVRDHRAIIAALARHDPDAAVAAVRQHLKGTVFASETLRAHFPEYFSTEVTGGGGAAPGPRAQRNGQGRSK